MRTLSLIGVILIVLKLVGVASVAALSWWWVAGLILFVPFLRLLFLVTVIGIAWYNS